jgi:type II secretory pathway component PulC
MSEDEAPRRMRLVAVGAAVLALLFTLVAVIVVVTRDGEPAQAAKVEPHFVDHVAKADDVVRLRSDVEVVVEQGATKGLRVKDPELAKSLGLVDGDVITALSGKLLTRETDSHEVILKMSLMSATTIYVEITRKGKPVLLRWKLDGDLRQARYASRSNDRNSVIDPFATPTYPTYPMPAPVLPTPDPLLDTIERVDDTHVRVPTKVLEGVLADPMTYSKGARVVPAIRNGKPDGFKLYAIRPSSLFARLGFSNGDTIHALNGFELTSADKALEVYTKLRDATSVSVDITRRGKPIELTIEIIK